MKEAMNSFEGAMNDLMDVCKAELGRELLGEEIDERAIGVIQKAFRLVDASMNLVRAQSDAMIEMNDKLDKLILRRELA